MRARHCQLLRGSTRVLETSDGARLDALWSVPDKANGYAAIVFHGNGNMLDSMALFADFYRRQGMHALLITMRGYPGSSGDSVQDGERGMYFDAAAAVEFVMSQGFSASHILAHGFSLGGALAAAAAYHHNLTALTLDHAFTSPSEVAVHVTREESEWLPEWLVKGAMGGAYQSGRELKINRKLTVKTDGLNTLSKVEQFYGAVFVIYGENDDLMPTSFAAKFLDARYPQWAYTEMQPEAIVSLQGGHSDLMFYQDPVASALYTEHLKRRVFSASQSTVDIPEVLKVEGFSMASWGFNGSYDLDPVMALKDPMQAVWHRSSSQTFLGVLEVAPSCIMFSPEEGSWVFKSANGHNIVSGLDSETPEGEWENGIIVTGAEYGSESDA
jgi:esterase/lipase